MTAPFIVMGALFYCFFLSLFFMLQSTICHLHNAKCEYQLHLNDANINSHCLIFALLLSTNYNKNTLILSMMQATKLMQMGRMYPWAACWYPVSKCCTFKLQIATLEIRWIG